MYTINSKLGCKSFRLGYEACSASYNCIAGRRLLHRPNAAPNDMAKKAPQKRPTARRNSSDTESCKDQETKRHSWSEWSHGRAMAKISGQVKRCVRASLCMSLLYSTPTPKMLTISRRTAVQGACGPAGLDARLQQVALCLCFVLRYFRAIFPVSRSEGWVGKVVL